MPILVESVLGVKGDFPLAEGKLLKDVMIQAPTLSYRDSIPLFIRQWNMVVLCSEDDNFYQLAQNHVDENLNNNSNWKLKEFGNSSSDSESRSTYNISFGKKDWVGANVLFKSINMADLYFHTVKRDSFLKSVVVNVGEVGTNELNKNVTIGIYRVLGYSWNIGSQKIRTMAELQSSSAQQIFSITTSVAGTSTSKGWDFQRIFDDLGININAYYKLFVGVTTNQYYTLNNVSVTLEIEEKNNDNTLA